MPGRAGAGNFSAGDDVADLAPVVLRRALREAGLVVTIAICTLALATSSYVMAGMDCFGSAIVAIVDVWFLWFC